MALAEAIFEPGRLAAVTATALLDTPAEEAFDRLTDMAGRQLDAPFDAARVTALARHTIRAAAMSEPEPEDVLAVLNQALAGAELPEMMFLSVRYGVLDVSDDGVEISLSSAGHPRPLLRRADGRVEEVAVRGTPLGVTDPPALDPVRIPLAPGDALVLYTDGVTGARGPDVLGGERLHDLLATGPDDAAGIADGIETAVRSHSSGPLADDMAVLVLSPTR